MEIRVVPLATGVDVPQNVHRPFSQVCPDEQASPHDPQFPASVWRSLHVPLQKFRPAGHDPLLTARVVPVSTVTVVPVSTDVVLVFWTNNELNCPFIQVSP
jgi:hypothetical protein